MIEYNAGTARNASTSIQFSWRFPGFRVRLVVVIPAPARGVGPFEDAPIATVAAPRVLSRETVKALWAVRLGRDSILSSHHSGDRQDGLPGPAEAVD